MTGSGMTGSGAGPAATALRYDPYEWETAHDPYPLYRRLRDEAPVYHNPERGFFALSRHADVLAAHNAPDVFVSSGGVTLEGTEAGSPALILMDRPEHTWHRRIVARVFTPRRIAALEPFIRRRTHELLDAVAGDQPFDVVEAFSARLPLDVISELIGIPEALRDDVHRLSDVMLTRGDSAPDRDTVMAAMGGLMAIYQDLVRDRRRHPTDDVISLIIGTEVVDDEGEPRRLSDDEVVYRFQELGFAGHETVAKLIPNGLIALTWFPEVRRRLTEDPGLVRTAVEEMLRWDAPSQYQGRTTSREVEMHGTSIPAGARVMLVTGSANHDERVYENPEVFDLDRRIEHPVSFGFGIHVCLGAHVARLETAVAFEELLTRYPDFEVHPHQAERHVHANVRGLSHLPVTLGSRVGRG